MSVPVERVHLDTVRRMARKLGRAVGGLWCVDELVSAGCEGLAKAANRFDPSRGAAFTTFAYPYIRGAILDAMDALPPRPAGVEVDALPDMATRPSPDLMKVVSFMSRLPKQQRELMERVYLRDMDVQEAAAEIGLSRSRGCRLHAQALAALGDAIHAGDFPAAPMRQPPKPVEKPHSRRLMKSRERDEGVDDFEPLSEEEKRLLRSTWARRLASASTPTEKTPGERR